MHWNQTKLAHSAYQAMYMVLGRDESVSKNIDHVWLMVEIAPLLEKFLQTDAWNAFLCLPKFY
jgi:hypothetical protein